MRQRGAAVVANGRQRAWRVDRIASGTLTSRLRWPRLRAMHPDRAAREEAGTSLVEILVGLGLMGLAMAGALALLARGLDAWQWGVARVDAQQAARAGLERMAGELRLAGYDPRGAGLA